MKTIQQFLQKPWLYLIIILIGVSLKFYNVDHRFFWFDEICTILHITGNEVWEIPTNKIVDMNTHIKDELHLRKRNLTIKEEFSRISKTTNLNPLHYYLLAFWYRIVGDDPVDYRFFSIFIFLITLPVLFLLAKSLFKSNLAGWIAVCMYSSSPFFHFFAQEARYYILWAFLFIMLQYLFLNAVSSNKLKWWIGYSIVGILIMYASILSGLIIIGHFVYLLITRKHLWLIYSINAILIFLGYLPWLIFLINRKEEIFNGLSWQSWIGNKNIFTLLIAQFVNMAASFVSLKGFSAQLNMLSSLEFQDSYLQLSISVLLVILIIYSIVYVIKKMPKEGSLFLLMIPLPQLLFFIISDLIRGTGGSMVYRYQLITFTGILFFIVFLFSRKIELGKLVYSGIFLGVIVLGFISIFNNSQNRCWDTPLDCEEMHRRSTNHFKLE